MAQQQDTRSGRRRLPYDDWMEAIGVPIYRGHFVEDLRNVELEWWEERKCKAAFLNLKGMEGVSEGRVQEIPAGETLPKLRMAIGELVYPLVGQGLVRMHGLLGLLLFGVTVAAVQTWLRPGPSRWPVAALLVVPPVFHQFVLIKNDLLLALPAFVALAWLLIRVHGASWQETAWAGWLAGLAAAGKLTNFPVALVMMVGVGCVAWRTRNWRPAGGLAIGGLTGGIMAGQLFTLTENVRWYGDVLARGPVAEMGNMTSGPAEALESIGRFALSLVDLGLLTGQLWPGRGGWAGTLGLPFIWAAVVLVLHYARAPEARWTIWIAAFHFAAFAAIFPDADLHHRLALAPGLLVVSVALSLLHRGEKYSDAARLALVPVVVLSSAQLLRSSVLYFLRAS